MGEIKSEKLSGLSAEELFVRGKGITYSDFNILDTNYTAITRDQVSLESDLGKGITLKIPIIGSPMDRVTNDRFCIALALEGGIGAIHFNHPAQNGKSSIDEQVEEIIRVKRFQSGFIHNPVAVAPEMTIREALESGARYYTGDSPIENFPVTHDGTSNGKLVGFLRKQDYFRGSRLECQVQERMQSREKVPVGRWPMTLNQAQNMLWDHQVSSLPILDNEGCLKYLVTSSDIEKHEKYPRATLDEHHRLRVLFAVSTRPPEAYERLERGFAADADGVIIDTSQGFAFYEQDMIRHILEKYPDKLVMGGNISTAEGTQFLAKEMVDAYRCGQGVGSICTTAGAIGIARAGATSVYECARSVRGTILKTIADGGLREAGDIVKALAVGAHACMLGNLLAGTEEGPGEVIVDPETRLLMKEYRGMGSKEANVGGKRGYTRMPEGVSGKVPYHGSVHTWVPLLVDAIEHAFEVLNYRSIQDIHTALYDGRLRFEQRTVGSLREMGVHDLIR